MLSEIKLKRTDTTLDLSQLAKRAKEEREKKIYKDGGREGRYLYVQGGERPGAQSVNSAGPSDREGAYSVRSVPVRLYLPDGPVIQDLVPPLMEDGKSTLPHLTY